MSSANYATEVVVSEGVCCENTRTYDHFCGNGSLLVKGKKSRCNSCGASVMAEVWKSNDVPPRVYMRKYCAEHGVTSTRLSSDSAFYFAHDGAMACGCGPGGCGPTAVGDNVIKAKNAQDLHTCTLVVEIVKDCNLDCPTCYADSPKTVHGIKTSDYLSFEDFKKQINEVLQKQGKIDIVQLSGGEPTLHPELFKIIAWLGEQESVLDTLLNTNGTRLHDPLFMSELAKVVPRGKFGVYLQFDGEGELGQEALRGGDFRNLRTRALHYCAKYEIPVALVMTVTHDNKFDCYSLIVRATNDDNIKWVVYQPEFISGRNDPSKSLEIPINVADIVHSVARGGVMNTLSWMPLPCSDPNCGTVGFLVRKDGQWLPVSDFVDMSQFAPLMANRMNFDIDDALASCGCDGYDLGSYLETLGIDKKDIKMAFIKPFMDVRTWDEDRIASCCTHVLTPEGKVDSFCRYYGSK